MPTYRFKNTKTGEVYEEFMKISERDSFLEENPDIEQLVYGAPGLADAARIGRMKPSDGFRDVLREIKKKNKGSTINEF
jgi:hypothetical protein